MTECTATCSAGCAASAWRSSPRPCWTRSPKCPEPPHQLPRLPGLFHAQTGGLMAELWMPGAQRLDIGDHAATDGGPAKAIAHITWDKNATAANPVALVPYENLRS